MIAYPALRATRRPLVFVMHGLDLVDFEDVRDSRLLVKPGLSVPLTEKVKYWSELLCCFARDFRLVTAEKLAREFVAKTDEESRA